MVAVIVAAQGATLETRPHADVVWHRVQHRLLAGGTALPAETVLELRDVDRR